jgi:hypothetical protein
MGRYRGSTEKVGMGTIPDGYKTERKEDQVESSLETGGNGAKCGR